MTATLFTSCSTENTTPKNENNQSAASVTENTTENVTEQATEETVKYNTLYFRDKSKSSKATATFFNSKSGESEDVEMKKISSDDEAVTFSCEGDCSAYNMAYITYGDKKTNHDFAFNRCTSGWYVEENELMPYTYTENGKSSSIEYEDITLTVGEYDKFIHVWKPDDYDASSDEKYSTIYFLDSDIISSFGTEQVRAMMSSTNRKAIVVAVENNFARNYELVPEIGVSRDEEMFGELKYDNMNGSEFSDFMADTLVPYVQKHYNVYTDAEHTSIAGVSLSGLEAFYITMEHQDKFGTLGGLSPSFWEYDAATWEKYLKDKSFNENSPFLYFYTGPEKLDTDPDVTDMYNRLKKMGYPEDKMVLHFNEKGTHRATYWCSMFPEFLAAMIFQRAELLQK